MSRSDHVSLKLFPAKLLPTSCLQSITCETILYFQHHSIMLCSRQDRSHHKFLFALVISYIEDSPRRVVGETSTSVSQCHSDVSVSCRLLPVASMKFQNRDMLLIMYHFKWPPMTWCSKPGFALQKWTEGTSLGSVPPPVVTHSRPTLLFNLNHTFMLKVFRKLWYSLDI